ncbi:MAG: FeoA family protein, partial [Synechococcales bacterium]|nr:FeoA family protein [Synechococcales bacterium]
MEPTSQSTLNPQFWRLTFIGGTADLDELPISQSDVATSPSHQEGCLPLAMTTVGDRVWVVQIKGGHQMVRRLTDMGIVQGGEVTIISRTESGSVIVALQGCRIGLGAGMAHRVMVTTVPQSVHSVTHRLPTQAVKQGDLDMPTILHPGALAVGQSGRIVGYERGSRAYREKLLSMGLTPGTHFTITRQAPMGDPIELEVRGYKLSL